MLRCRKRCSLSQTTAYAPTLCSNLLTLDFPASLRRHLRCIPSCLAFRRLIWRDLSRHGGCLGQLCLRFDSCPCPISNAPERRQTPLSGCNSALTASMQPRLLYTCTFSLTLVPPSLINAHIPLDALINMCPLPPWPGNQQLLNVAFGPTASDLESLNDPNPTPLQFEMTSYVSYASQNYACFPFFKGIPPEDYRYTFAGRSVANSDSFASL